MAKSEAIENVLHHQFTSDTFEGQLRIRSLSYHQNNALIIEPNREGILAHGISIYEIDKNKTIIPAMRELCGSCALFQDQQCKGLEQNHRYLEVFLLNNTNEPIETIAKVANCKPEVTR